MAKGNIELTFSDERVPLQRAKDGTVYVKGSKVTLEGIVFTYKRGCSPEEIQRAFDAVSLGDVYSVIGYYLRRQQEVQGYLEEYERDWDKFVEETLAKPGARDFYDRLEELRRQKESDDQATTDG